ncbi:hypothetical protein G647_05858 [Cladophialophora carrionii CBS 160.54]|uniref:Uncharacterized protein n=1 Tax=Cladophialophora carrionii CBS 160.54 TaxID=1279043 RepID=V9D4F2_9EURO|nr:uncharacterized protein G647_05858 [Cladophialophora carrionii CBS 160.54]ETI21789.1 hypothetical protein G647_05858 [Cladophialophora carrionii CBS 160.54]
MSSSIIPKNEPRIQARNPFARPGPIPEWRLEGLYVERAPSLVARDEASSTTSTPAVTTSCGKNDNSGACEKYYGSGGSDTTLPIVLGVVIPLGIALVVLIYLHRRHVRKLRREDADDRHKSLDFGLEVAKQGDKKRNGRKVPEMSMAEGKEAGLRRGRGLSLDMGAHNPYLLPPELQNSRESLHSLSRLNTGDDKYRATDFIPDDGSIRPPSSMRSPHDDSSSFTGSSSRRFQSDSKQSLLANGAPPSGRVTPTGSISGSRNPVPPVRNNNLLAPTVPEAARDSVVSTTSSIGAINALRASNNYLGQFISGGTPSAKEDLDQKEPTTSVKEVKGDTPVVHVQPPPPVVIKNAPPVSLPSADSAAHDRTPSNPTLAVTPSENRQPRLPQLSFIDSQGHKQQAVQTEKPRQIASISSQSTPQHSNAPSTDISQHPSDPKHHTSQDQAQTQVEEEDYYDEYEAYGDYDQQYYDDQDYQDYYDYQEQWGHDPRRSMMGLRPLPPDDPSENPEDRANRIRSFYKEYFDDSKNVNHGQQAQYYDGSEGYHGNYHQGHFPEGYNDQAAYHPPRGMSQAGTYGRHRATISNGSYQPGPRAFSSASSRYGGPRMPPPQKLPPPAALNLLPTPHKLKEDTFLPIDFAPPKKYHNQRAGTPDSLRGGLRPYSPSVRPHIPLVSSFDDLAVIPSPHQLRKSSTFTALDFAPPGRLRTNDTASETGSIRSNRSGISALHARNIRTGAYRVSRIPKEVAGTRDELAAALRPQWDLNR